MDTLTLGSESGVMGYRVAALTGDFYDRSNTGRSLRWPLRMPCCFPSPPLFFILLRFYHSIANSPSESVA